MTALKQYERLEASGLWRASPEDQRREVIVSIGEATLTITDMNDRALTHWSLAAVTRKGDGFPALYHPIGDPSETLELDENQTEMIDAIRKVRAAIDRTRPRPGRLRLIGGVSSLAVLLGLTVFWLPGALKRHTVSVVPAIKAVEIGEDILGNIERVAGRACLTPEAKPVLDRLAERAGVRRLVILNTGTQASAALPGGIILLNKAVIEDHEDPAVAAGFILTERLRSQENPPLFDLLTFSGTFATIGLLTTGELPEKTLDAYAEALLLEPRPVPPEAKMLATFAEAQVPTRPYAYAVDITGESVLGLIEADPMAGKLTPPVMPDRDWLILQSICGN
jgi:hypothetical protein